MKTKITKLVNCFIGLGSNLNNPYTQIEQAVLNLSKLPGTNIIAISSLYNTKPVGYLDQPDFVNAVVKVSTILSPEDLLNMLLKIEKKQGRVRDKKIRFGPRTLDLDLLLYGEQIINKKNLIVPHPRMLERNFVLQPLTEIEPNWQVFFAHLWFD